MTTQAEFEILCFDCDSTLSKIEGIDECAKQVGLGVQMAELTNAAMNGELPLAAVYAQRLNLIRPNQAAITALANLYIEQIVDGVSEVFARLHKAQKQLHIISGGLRPAILPLARLLNVPEQQVHAVDIYFDANGDYVDFDRDSPLSQNGGKALICQKISSDYPKMLMIGDGQTDLEARTVGVKVMGFGGVVERAAVKQTADFYIEDFRQILNYLLIR
jgi:phosphoserine phosphatase